MGKNKHKQCEELRHLGYVISNERAHPEQAIHQISVKTEGQGRAGQGRASQGRQLRKAGKQAGRQAGKHASMHPCIRICFGYSV